MSRHLRSLENIRVASPCSADWDSMQGNERVRFCDHCARSVHDLSAMTRKSALRLVRESGGELCIRYTTRADGSIETLPRLAGQLHQIGRRASRVAAGAAAAAISLAPGAATRTLVRADNVVQGAAVVTASNRAARADSAVAGRASLSGVVTDPAGAVVAGASVTLLDENTKARRTATTGEEGGFEFTALDAGAYTLRVESPGFIAYEEKGIVLESGDEYRVKPSLLSVGVISGEMIILEPNDPLVKAASKNNLPAVKRLLAGGRRAATRDRVTDATALDEAVENANLEMARLLLGAGAEPNARNKEGRTALMMLDEENDSADIIRALVDAGADVNIRDDEGESALGHAATREDVSAVRALLDAGADANGVNEEGETALMLAAEEGNVECVRVLLAAGADVNLEDEDGDTALERAQGNGHEEVVELLKAHGAAEKSPEP